MKIRIAKENKIDVIMEVFHKNNNTWNWYVTCRDWGGKMYQEAFSGNLEFLVRAILRQSKFLISAKNYPIDFWMVLNESWEHATFHDTITQNYQGVLFAPHHTYIHHYCKSLTNYVFTSSYVGSIDLVCVCVGGGAVHVYVGTKTHELWSPNT